jgi:3',5'-cyclic AMP phosphodiesterase CpdA
MNRIIRNLGIVLILLCTITITGNSQKKDSSAPFFIIQVTDPQFGFIESNKGFSKETELYEKIVGSINRLSPEFVVITGDLVHNKDDSSQFIEFKRITSKINPLIPVMIIPGNHDIGVNPSERDLDIYKADFGDDKFSLRHKNSLFIGLNSSLIKAGNDKKEQSQFDWLRNELAESKQAEHIILFCHYPFFIKSFDEPESYSNLSAEARTKYFNLFKVFKVNAVYAGHLHENSLANFENIQMITTGPAGKPLGTSPSGIRIIKIYPDRIESNYYGVDSIPEKIIF